MSIVLLHGSGPVPADATAVVALTPSALQAYPDAVVVDDVVDSAALVADRHEYVAWQLDWLNRLDRAAGADGALRASALNLLTPIDSVVIQARRLRALLAGLDARSVQYVGPVGDASASPFHAGHLQFWPRLGDTPLVAQLLPLAAAELGLDATFNRAAGDPPLTAPATVARSGSWLRRHVGPLVRRIQVLWPPVVRPRGSTLMLWTSGYGAAAFAAAERKAGNRTFVLQRGRPATRVLGPTLVPVGPAIPTVGQTGGGGGAKGLPLEEVDRWAGITGAGELLASRVGAAVELARAVERAARGLQPQLRLARIDRMAAANPSSVEEFAALLAARRVDIRRLLLQHGDHLFRYDSWLVSETQNFEELWVSDATVADDLGEAAASYGVPALQFRVRSPRVEALREAAAAPGDPRTVVYVPSVLLGDSWVFGGGRFEDAWYHRWHLRLLGAMAAHPEYEFVWKAFPAADQSADPLPEEIERRGIANVRYETGPLVPWLQQAGRVITDFPSTPLYEAVHVNRSVLALVFNRFAEVRHGAAAVFAPVLRRCDSEEEALAAVERFLAEPADQWVVPSGHVLPT